MDPQLQRMRAEIAARRTFAIISHPDAGKTTLTEKLLLYGGALHLAGSVKRKGGGRAVTSDWRSFSSGGMSSSHRAERVPGRGEYMAT